MGAPKRDWTVQRVYSSLTQGTALNTLSDQIASIFCHDFTQSHVTCLSWEDNSDSKMLVIVGIVLVWPERRRETRDARVVGDSQGPLAS